MPGGDDCEDMNLIPDWYTTMNNDDCNAFAVLGPLSVCYCKGGPVQNDLSLDRSCMFSTMQVSLD